MLKTKVFAAYLPQFHITEYNDKFWGKNFTDWVNVKVAEPQFPGHYQPRVPMGERYYDLSDPQAIHWQAKTAKTHGVDGFNIYHYWFKDGKQALEKPAEMLLQDKSIDIEYFFSWDNCSWVRSWGKDAGNAWAPVSDKNKSGASMLFEQDYGDRVQWEKHFNYLLPFFKDERYLRIEGKPVFAFMTSFDKVRLVEMASVWKELAIKSGFDGLYLISRKDEFANKHLLDNQFKYQPASASWGKRMSIEGRLKRHLHLSLKSRKPVKYMYSYDTVWKRIIKDIDRFQSKKLIPGCFVGFDDTPRRGKQAGIIVGQTPDKFKKYFSKFYKICCNNDRPILLITAWNEWGEGAYLEPDEKYGYAYLDAIRDVKESTRSN